MRRHLWWVLGSVLVVAGLVVVVSQHVSGSDYGWFAYTPLSDGEWSESWPVGDPVRVVTGWQLAGAAVAVVGLLVLAAGAGYRRGRRSRDLPAV